jgi:hypothetical protein
MKMVHMGKISEAYAMSNFFMKTGIFYKKKHLCKKCKTILIEREYVMRYSVRDMKCI